MTRKKTCPTCQGTGEVEPPFGKRISELRKAEGWTQDVLAKKMGVARASLANIEGGRQEVGSAGLVILARVFNVSTDYLLGLSD